MPERFFATLKFVGVAGVGLLEMDISMSPSASVIVPMIGYLYFADNEHKVPTVSGDTIKASLSIGMICGQLLFGLFGDALGRHRVYGKELMLTLFGTMMVILMPWGTISHQSVVAWMAVFRVVTGCGTGGDYPMTSAYAVEQKSSLSRAKLLLTVFTCLGIGEVTVGIVYVILLSAFKSSIESDLYRLQWVWRLLLGIGLVPLAGTLYFRLTMPESKPYQDYVTKDTSLTSNDKRGLGEQFRDFREYFGCFKHAKALIGTAGCWFLFDIAFYGVNLNQSVILGKIGYGVGATPYETLYNTAVGNIIVMLAGTLPGYIIAIWLPDIMGRVRQQWVFSFAVAILYAIWAGVTNHTTTGGLITLFVLSQLTIGMGPNATTFLIPAEVFPTRVRGTAHGISAAAGKVGALITAFGFGSVVEAIGLSGTLGFLSGIMALCGLLSFLIPDTSQQTLADIEADQMYGTHHQSTDGQYAPATAAAAEMSPGVSSMEKLKLEDHHATPKLSI